VLAHLVRPGGAVQADGVDAERLERGERGADLGAHQHGSGGFDRHLDEDGEDAAGHDGLLAAVDRGFGLQEVLAGLDEEGARSPVDEAPGLHSEGLLEVVVAGMPEAGELGARPHRAQDPAHPSVCFLCRLSAVTGFSVGSRVPGSKPDAYFDPKAEDILSSYFLAAALGVLPITQVYLWVTEQVNREPINILKAHDYELQYKGLESTLELADKQRDGIFGTAEKMIQCLKSRNTLRWVAPMRGATVATDARRQFNPHAFAASQETIYILSKEGAGSASPLTTALTVAIAEAMEERAERSGGRLPKPALFALDELANVVRWAALPDQFSHYGSKGLIVMGILQSWSQGVELWGEANMRKIWSAANVKVYGGGVAEEGFLRALSDLIGDYSSGRRPVPGGHPSFRRPCPHTTAPSRRRQPGVRRAADPWSGTRRLSRHACIQQA
jgi:hypothetical protein